MFCCSDYFEKNTRSCLRRKRRKKKEKVVCVFVFLFFLFNHYHFHRGLLGNIGYWFVNVGSMVCAVLCFLANFKFTPMFFWYYFLMYALFTTQSFLQLDSFTDGDGDVDSLFVTLLSFQFITMICALYSGIVSIVGFKCVTREDKGSKEKLMPRVVIAWTVFAMLGIGCLAAANVMVVISTSSLGNVQSGALIVQWIIR